MADEKWNAYRGAARDAAARVDAKKGIKTTRPAQTHAEHTQTPHHTNTISSYRDTVDRGSPSGAGGGLDSVGLPMYGASTGPASPTTRPAYASDDDYDSEPIPHNVRGQQAYRDRGYY